MWEFDDPTNLKIIADTNLSNTIHPYWIVEFKGKLSFDMDDGITGTELWVYNGINKPNRINDLNAGALGSELDFLTVYNNKLFFSAWDGIHGAELWVYDGVNEPNIVYDLNPGSNSSSPKNLTIFDGKLYFMADNGLSGDELWVYDSIHNPSLVFDIFPGINDALYPTKWSVYKIRLLFWG